MPRGYWDRRMAKHRAKHDHYIATHVLNNPLFDIRPDGTIWTRVATNGGLIPDEGWRRAECIGDSGHLYVWVKTGTGKRGTVKGERGVNIFAHRIVFAKYGKEPLDTYKIVNHIDGNKTNNLPDNLELITPPENSRHAMMNLGHSPIKNAKLSFKIADEIRELRKGGASYRELCQKYNISKGHVSEIVNNKIWYREGMVTETREDYRDEPQDQTGPEETPKTIDESIFG